MIVGDPLFGEDAYGDDIRTRAQVSGIGDRVRWLGFRDDIPQLMRASDLVVHTSVLPEPFGRVIVEAMMARRPVIASAHGASRELLGETYPLLVEPGDPEALAIAIRRVLRTGPAEMAALVATNYARACALFSTDKMFAEIDQAIAA
jgi:glycosyltransferase involved in cell wall biosynthesis